MAGEWRETTLGEFAPFAYGKGLPEHTRDPSGSVPVFGSNGIVGFHSEPLTSGPTIIIGRKGTVGAIHFSSKACWPIDTTFYVSGEDLEILQFKYYLLKSLSLEYMNADSAVPGLNREAAHALKICIPPLPEQRAIAHILGTLDDKIELNRRMSETLEQMARALFKAWFVDFEPVRAKMEGRWKRGQSLPGLPAHLYDLFPDRLVDSELGEIPEGWRLRSIGEVVKRLPVGKKYDQKTVKPIGKVPVLDQGQTGIIGYHDDEPSIVASEEYPVVVFANHTCYMRLIYFPFSTIQNVIPFVGQGVDTIWLFHATYGKQPFIEYKGHWPDFIIHKIVVPDPKVADQFSRLVYSLLKMIWAKERESRTLAALRDALLPKLISGELRVKDAERFLKERRLVI
jgi:type I restriction enzyme S subunit